MSIRSLLFVCAIAFASTVAAQFPDIRLLRPFDGTSANIVAARCPSLNYSAELVSFERVGNELRFVLRMPRISILGNPEFLDYYLALEHFVDASEAIGDELRITLRYRPAYSLPHDPDLTCSQLFRREASTTIDRSVPAESGWWVDYRKGHERLGRGLMLDRGVDRIELRYLTFTGSAPADASFVEYPQSWLNGVAQGAGPYFSLPMTTFLGGYCLPCAGSHTERTIPAGRLILFLLSPTTAILAPPNEPARLIEQAAFPSDRFPQRTQSTLTGRWAIVGNDDSILGGFPIELGAEESGDHFISYPIIFRFGTGRFRCDYPQVCKLYLRFTGLDHEFELFDIPADGIGNQKLYVQDSQGNWRPVMVRID